LKTSDYYIKGAFHSPGGGFDMPHLLL